MICAATTANGGRAGGLPVAASALASPSRRAASYSSAPSLQRAHPSTFAVKRRTTAGRAPRTLFGYFPSSFLSVPPPGPLAAPLKPKPLSAQLRRYGQQHPRTAEAENVALGTPLASDVAPHCPPIGWCACSTRQYKAGPGGEREV